MKSVTISNLERLHAQLKAAQRISHIGSWELQISNGTLSWSEEASRIFGLDPMTVDASLDSFWRLVHPDDQARLQAAQAHAVKNNLPLDIEHRIVRQDGEIRHIHERAEMREDDDGHAVLTGTVHDITERRRAEESLQQREALLQFASTVSRIGAWDVDLSKDRVVWSDQVCAIHEIPAGTMPTHEEMFNFYMPESREKIKAVFAACARDGTPFDEELMLITGTGRRLWVHVMGQAVRADGKITHVRGSFHDIMEKKLAQEQALHFVTRLANTLETITDAFFTLDADWRFTYLNQEAERILQHARTDLLGKVVWEEFGEAVGSVFEHEYRRAVRDGCPVQFESFYSPLNVWLEVRAYPSVDGLAVYFRDITLHKQQLEMIRESDERFKMAIKATSDTIWDWNLKSDSIWRSEGSQSRFNFTPDELETGIASWSKRLHPDDRDRVLKKVRGIIEGSGEKSSIEYRFLRNDGSYAHVLDRSFVIRDADGRAVRMVGSMADITAQKQAALELRQLNRALRMRSACDELLYRITDENEFLSSICDLVRKIGGYSLAWVGNALNDAMRSIEIVAHAGEAADTDYVSRLQLSWSEEHPTGLGLGPAARAIRQGAAVVTEDVTRLPDVLPWMTVARRRNYRGEICLPLRNKAGVFGVMALYSKELIRATDEEVTLLQELADHIAFGIDQIRFRRERRRIESAVSKVAASISAGTGTTFFEQLARNMGEAVGAQASFIVRLLPGEPRCARTIAVVIDGAVIPDFDYALAGTPCEQLLDAIEWVVPDGVVEQFPRTLALAGFDSRAYVGRRLENSAGQPLGMLFVLFDKPLTETTLLTSALRIFASRAAAELERQEADARIQEQASLLDKAKDAIIVRGLDNRVRFWNKGAERLYGWTEEEAVGRSVAELFFIDPAELQATNGVVLRDGQWSGELTERRKDGSLLTVEAQLTLMSDEQGEPQAIFAIKTDITQRKAAQQEIQMLAYYDALTRLPNRRLLLDRLLNALAGLGRSGCQGALLYIDLDNFKTVNDTLGHDQGDELLRQVAGRLVACVRGSDTVARLGGDEFVVMLENLAADSSGAAAQAMRVGEKILAALRAPFLLAKVQRYSTPSIGITLFTHQQVSPSELMKQADMAMYQAKSAGRNMLRFFSPAMQTRAAARAELESDLRRGLQDQEFVLHFQPQVDRDGVLTGAEALVRWRHPARGMVTPVEFIPLAEETGLIVPLGQWVLEDACTQLAAWAQHALTASLTLSVNVSARQFLHRDFVEQVASALDRAGARPRQLKIELTESLLVDNVEEIIEKMTALQARGVGFSLDDFGTGYSSLTYLKRLPLDQVKIDQSFIRNVLTDPHDAAIVRMVIALGHSLGLTVIAEGVETGAQQDFLARHGCHVYQGYLFSPALPIEEFHAYAQGTPLRRAGGE